MTKVAVIGTVGIPACYGGFESLVEYLTKYSSDAIKYHVFCSSKSYSEKKSIHNGAVLSYIPLSANGIQSIPYDIFSLVKCLFIKPDVTLILGVSGCVFLPIYRFFSSSKIVTNIDGLEWKRDKWGHWTKRFLKLSESLAIKYSDVIIADNKAIGDYVVREYGFDNEVIAYGGDHVIPINSSDVKKSDFYLSLCRVEPENNVEMILDSFSRSDKKLKFIGNWDRSDYGSKLKGKYSSFPNIEILDPIYDLSELYVLRKSCIGYIHGHSAGGTNPSLVEAMHFGMCIYAFDCDFNRYSTENTALYFSSVDSLLNILVSQDDGIVTSQVGENMKKIAMSRYTWETVSRQYESTYLGD
ncbi:DUF1972 domain-containing protein [Enterovibrio norvegicus]|uniref:DUF1972 domain-containing protein n=1 Tax=Enterovibrio norvegicus TaxID=188144 RepID=UPI000C859ECC|nr:DUF1972 domain-containing protein [Enterovibrio norvegicus]PMN71098.1 glycosyl transferase [Enterovibrio norvegicus]